MGEDTAEENRWLTNDAMLAYPPVIRNGHTQTSSDESQTLFKLALQQKQLPGATKTTQRKHQGTSASGNQCTRFTRYAGHDARKV